MNSWSNIVISPDDLEITQLDKIEKSFGDISVNVLQIRELITRFEICHFKYQNHILKIIESVSDLQPVTEPGKIGANHIHQGDNGWKNDKTGRSLLGQNYLWTLRNWLAGDNKEKDSYYNNQELNRLVKKWLGIKNPDKERLILLLIARLTWDWKSYEELKRGREYKELEIQVCSMDICHYAFPGNLNLLLQAIGELKPTRAFKGCGSFDTGIQAFIEKEFSILDDLLQIMVSSKERTKDKLIKAWLIACLLKTLKEQIGMSQSISLSGLQTG